MEKRGVLTPKEGALLGDWIFGCDECLAICPGTTLPSPFELDLRWLLEASSAETRRAISNTALEYAGVTLLRRNAIIVLANRRHPETEALISRFSRTTGSDLLRATTHAQLSDIRLF